jgi:hypothetical protein
MSYLNKPSDTLMLDLINNTPGNIPVRRDQITFGKPIAKISSDPNVNTGLRVSAVVGKGYTGYVDVEYFRLDIASLFEGIDVILDVPDAQTSSDLLARLNAKYDLGIVATEVIENPVSHDVTDANGAMHTLFFKDSLVYIGHLTLWVGPEDGSNIIRWEDGSALRWEDGSVMMLEETA